MTHGQHGLVGAPDTVRADRDRQRHELVPARRVAALDALDDRRLELPGGIAGWPAASQCAVEAWYAESLLML